MSDRVQNTAIAALFVAALSLILGSGCDNAISLRASCEEQAVAWCDRAAPGAGDCITWLIYTCQDRRTGEVPIDEHAECLEAIELNERPQQVPPVCQAQWGYPVPVGGELELCGCYGESVGELHDAPECSSGRARVQGCPMDAALECSVPTHRVCW